jgi:hypothetical protein
MTIQNFKYISRKGKVYIIDGVIELFNNTGFGFTKLLRINGVEEDSLPLRQKIKHEDILNFIKKIDKK